MYRPSEKILSHKSGQLQSALNLISPKYLFFYLVFFQKKGYRSFSDRIIAITIKINFKKDTKTGREIKAFEKSKKQLMLLRSYILSSFTMPYHLISYFKNEEHERGILT